MAMTAKLWSAKPGGCRVGNGMSGPWLVLLYVLVAGIVAVVVVGAIATSVHIDG